MKLIRFGTQEDERPGLQLEDGARIDVSQFGEDYSQTFFQSDGIARLRQWLKENRSRCPFIKEEIRWAAPLKQPSKIVCVGLNYSKHAAESKMKIPKEPVLFFKSTSSIVGPYDDLILPRNSHKTDWEVELAVVIGQRASYVSETEAMNYIAGYLLHNDYSERAFQLEREGQWVKGKSSDTFAPLGPFLATKEEIPDPHDLNLWLKVNHNMMQNDYTSDLIFSIPRLISYISDFMTLLPGDIISTGTPAGVGLGFNPPKYLQPGDVVELGITGLGQSRQKVRSYVEK